MKVLSQFAFLVLFSGQFISTAALAQGYPSPPPPHSAPSYGLQEYQQEEGNSIYWNQKFNAAPSGSWEEGYAREQRDQSIRRALGALRGYQVFDRMSSQEIEAFADEQNRKYQSAPSGSALETLYSQARNIGYDAFQRQLQVEVDNLRGDWRQLDQYGMNMDRKYQSAPSGSEKERAYDRARRTVYDRLPEAVRRELSRVYDFRSIEETGLYFIRKYNASPSGSVAEAAYRRTNDLAFTMASDRFEYSSRSYSQNDLYYIIEEYNRKYQSAPSSSRQERYFAQIRDIARRAADRGH